MTPDEALEVARDLENHDTADYPKAVVALATTVIGMREAETDVAATWQQFRGNALVPPELRRALDTFVEKRSA